MLNPDTQPTFVVVYLKDPDRSKSGILKMGINPRNISYDDPRVFYLRHGLDSCFPAIYVEGPMITGKIEISSGVPHRSLAYFFAHHCSKYLIMNFSQSPPHRKASDFPFFITIGNLLSVDEKIYVFGNENPGVLSAYTFDPNKHEWERLSLPMPDDLIETRFVVVSLGKMILTLHVDNQLQFVYDPKLLTWTRVDYKDLLRHFCSIVDYPITVEEHNTIYWLDSEANIRAFDYQLSKHYYGAIVGFAHEPIVRGRESGAAPLIHLMGGLFAIVWKKDHTDLHITLVRISRGPKARSSYDSDHHLFVNVVSCFHHHINPHLDVHGAFKL